MLIVLKREFVADFDAFTSQWREYIFNTLDPDGPILENLVINSTAFELADNVLVWTNPDTGDEYFYDLPEAVTKVAGSGPVVPPVPPDLSDPYGLKYVHEYSDWDQRTCRFEIYRKDYVGEEEEVDGEGQNLSFSYENKGKLFQPFRGSRATLRLTSQVSRKFYELFEGDERDHYGRFVRDAVVLWTGWITPDIFSEPWANPPYQTGLNFNDGIGGLKNLSFPDVNANGFTGLVSEKDAIIACLSRVGLRLNVHMALNLTSGEMTGTPVEESMVNMETFVKLSKGENLPLNCYDVMSKILRSWNAVLLQESNVWWIVREPELYAASLSFVKYDPDGVLIGTDTLSLTKTFAVEGIQLHGANLETKPAFTNVAVSQENGELLVENGNFAVNGDLENWVPYILGGYQQGWKLKDWTYDKLEVFPFTNSTSLGRVRRVTEKIDLKTSNNFINIYDVVRSFGDPVGRLISKPFPIKKEVGNLIQVACRFRANTYGSDNRLVEAYFNIAVKCGTKWLSVTGDVATWTPTETRIQWKIAEVMRWEDIVLPSVEIPEDGDVSLYLYQIVQVGSVSKVIYVFDVDNVQINLVDNPALQNERVYYKTNNPETYTSTLEELKIELGDVATVMSQNAKIVNDSPTSEWSRAGVTESLPLAELLCRELANQYQRTTYRLMGGRYRADSSRLSNYEDTVNEPDRKFLLTGGEWNAKSGEWSPDFVEINQTETTVEIRVVQEAKSGSSPNTGSNSGGGPDGEGSTEPVAPSVPVDLGDLDDVIPIIRDGRFEDSGIKAIRDFAEDIIQYQFDKPVRGLPGVEADEFVTLSQLPNIPQYGLLSGGTIQYTGTGFSYVSSLAIVATGEILTAPASASTLDAADASFDRFDVLGWRYVSAGVAELFYLKGTAAASPTIPQVDPETEVEGLVVLVPALATVPPSVVTEDVYLENTEWTVSKTGIGTMDPASTDNPKSGTKAVKSTEIANQYKVRFTRASTIDLTTLTDATLGFDLDLIATMANNQLISVIFLDASLAPASNAVSIQFNRASLAYQFIGLDLTLFTFLTTTIKAIEIRFAMKGGGTHAGFYLDNVKLQGGVDQPVSSNTHNTLLGLQGGTSTERYHVTKDQADAAAAAASPSTANPFATMADVGVGGGIASVTGDGVDNTDPDNPILTFPTPAEINAEPEFLKGDLIAGTNVSLSGTLTGRLVGTGNVTINSTGGGGGTSGLTLLTGFPVIPFDQNYRYSHEMAGPVEISVNTTLARTFPNHTVLYVKANGVDKPTFKTSDNFSILYDGWNNTNGEWNRIRIEWSPQGNPVVQIMDTSGAANPGTGAIDFELLFDDDYSFSHVITGTVSLSVDATGAAYAKKTIYYFMADGTNKPMWASPIECNFDNYVNVAGVWNRFFLEYTPENKVTLQIQNT
jgi:hypothetical protein